MSAPAADEAIDQIFAELRAKLGGIAAQLRCNANRVSEPACACSAALATVIDLATTGRGVSNQHLADRIGQVLSAAQVVAPADFNGFGDTLIRPAYLRVGLTVEAEEWNRLANDVRSLRYAYLAALPATETDATAVRDRPRTQ